MLGELAEEMFCWLRGGQFESRQGLLVGPLNQVYGLGLVLMIAFLDGFPTRNGYVIFVACALIGEAFEFFCSYFQEQIFGSVSWDYPGSFLSLGGRTNATFMLLWGLGGVVVYRYIMP